LRGPATPAREDALARLHPLLLRATQFALSRRADHLSGLGTADIDDLAVQAADDALMSILSTLDDYRGASRFTTWASKFAVHEAGVKGRRGASPAREPWGGPQADDEVGGTP
jgi:RNA polymerase sigma-70 factor (ECF subfamily)